MHKVLTFKEREVLSININYPKPGGKKTDKFYAQTAKSFLNFCERRLYKHAAEQFLLLGEDFEVFSAGMNFAIKRIEDGAGAPLIKIYIDTEINGEQQRMAHTWNLSGELIKPQLAKPRKT